MYTVYEQLKLKKEDFLAEVFISHAAYCQVLGRSCGLRHMVGRLVGVNGVWHQAHAGQLTAGA